MKFSANTNRVIEIDETTWPINRLSRNTVLSTCGVGWSPHDHFDEIWPDLDRLIKSITYGSTDLKNVNLHDDELYGELVHKMTVLLNRRDTVFEDRASFFGFMKLSLSRHLSSIIQKNVFTEKRTGVKPPKRGEKPVEEEEKMPEPERPHGHLELDDDEHGVANYVGHEDGGFKERDVRDALEHFIKAHLTEVEAKVIRQEMEPNDRAMELAFLSAQGSGKKRTYKIQDRHKAEGIDMQVYAYKRTLGKIRVKMLRYWNK